MRKCTRCNREIQPHVLNERIGKDVYCVPCADDLWKEGPKDDYRICCMSCFGHSHLQLFPQRVGRDVVGILVLCIKCSHIARGKQCIVQIVWHESKPQMEKVDG